MHLFVGICLHLIFLCRQSSLCRQCLAEKPSVFVRILSCTSRQSNLHLQYHGEGFALYTARICGLCVYRRVFSIIKQQRACSCLLFAQAAEVEETLKRIRSHRGVEGILIINNDGVALKSTMTAEQTSQYSAEMSRLCAMARSSVRTLDSTVSNSACVCLTPRASYTVTALRMT